MFFKLNVFIFKYLGKKKIIFRNRKIKWNVLNFCETYYDNTTTIIDFKSTNYK